MSKDNRLDAGECHDPSSNACITLQRSKEAGTCAVVSGKGMLIIRRCDPSRNAISFHTENWMHYQRNVLTPTQSTLTGTASLRWESNRDAGIINRPPDINIEGAFHVSWNLLVENYLSGRTRLTCGVIIANGEPSV